MKLAFFVTEFPALTETFISNQIIGLQNEGYEIHVYSSFRPSLTKVHQTVLMSGLIERTFYLDKFPKSRLQKMKMLTKKIISNFSSYTISTLFKFVFQNQSKLSVYDLTPFLDKPEYDIVHAHFGVNGNYVTQLRKLGLFKKAKFVTAFHGYDLNEVFIRDNYYTELFQDCHLFTTNSLYSKDMLLKLGCKEADIHLLPVGLDMKIFGNKNISKISDEKPKALRIVFVGRLIEFKAPDLVIRIAEVLNKRAAFSFEIKIIGHGDMYSMLQKSIQNKKLESVVNLMGTRTQEEIISIFEESEIFLFPGITYQNRAENQGLVIQEAQAMQLPVIISDAGGMKEGMVDGVTGFVVPESDIKAFVEKIELLANDSTLRKNMGEAGRKFVTENFDIHKLNEKLLQIYLK